MVEQFKPPKTTRTPAGLRSNPASEVSLSSLLFIPVNKIKNIPEGSGVTSACFAFPLFIPRPKIKKEERKRKKTSTAAVQERERRAKQCR